jgi:fructose/tagatose bisphosphate aldolase
MNVNKFIEATGIDFLAPALGSVHGIYKGEPKLDLIE